MVSDPPSSFMLIPTLASNAGGVGRNRDSRRISDYRSITAARASNNCDRPLCSLSHGRRRIGECLFIRACSMDEYAEEKRTEQSLLYAAVNLKPEVTNNRRRRSRYRAAEANYRQTRRITRPFCDSRPITCAVCGYIVTINLTSCVAFT